MATQMISTPSGCHGRGLRGHRNISLTVRCLLICNLIAIQLHTHVAAAQVPVDVAFEGMAAKSAWRSTVALRNGHTVRCQDTKNRDSRLQVPVDVAFEGPAAKSAWRSTVALGLHAHGWVRTASARLLGSAFAHPRVGESQERGYVSRCRQAAAVELWQGLQNSLGRHFGFVQAIELCCHTLHVQSPEQQGGCPQA